MLCDGRYLQVGEKSADGIETATEARCLECLPSAEKPKKTDSCRLHKVELTCAWCKSGSSFSEVSKVSVADRRFFWAGVTRANVLVWPGPLLHTPLPWGSPVR